MRALAVILAVAGLYLLVAHTDPVPFNHVAVGIGTQHVVHAVIGAVLLVAALFVWRRGARAPVA